MDFFSILTLLGGLAMFLYGMQVMGDGLEKLSGESFFKQITGSSGWRCRDSSYSIVISNDSYGCRLCKLRNHALIPGRWLHYGSKYRYYDYCMDS